MRAAIYARVSTGKQAAQDLSIPDQIRRCEDYCASRGWEVVKSYIDAGASATSDNRPEFQAMIAEACSRHNPFDVLLVHSQSRFARNTLDLLLYTKKLEKHGVQFVSITQDIGGGDQADVLRTMLGAMDEYHSKETSKHVSRSLMENARQGFWNGSLAPFGYRTYDAEKRGAKVKKKLEIDPVESEIVRLTFRLYVFGDGKSGPIGLRQILNWLAEAGHRHREGRPFRVQTLQKLLRNTAYVGEYYYYKYDRTKRLRPREDWILCPIPRIVDDAVFYAAQDKLDRQHPLKTAPRIVNSSVLLTGIAYCGACGAPLRQMTGKGGRYRYYNSSMQAPAHAPAVRCAWRSWTPSSSTPFSKRRSMASVLRRCSANSPADRKSERRTSPAGFAI